MTLSSFQRFLEDVLREELLTMGLDYDDVIASIISRREGETLTVRFHGDLHDLDVIEPAVPPSRAALAAQVRRKLKTALRRRD